MLSREFCDLDRFSFSGMPKTGYLFREFFISLFEFLNCNLLLFEFLQKLAMLFVFLQTLTFVGVFFLITDLFDVSFDGSDDLRHSIQLVIGAFPLCAFVLIPDVQQVIVIEDVLVAYRCDFFGVEVVVTWWERPMVAQQTSLSFVR